MPGNLFYKLNLIQEELLKFWYVGDLAQFKYNLNQSDKYLVEAKILFDYKQYLLANNALMKSNDYYKKIVPSLISARNNGKDISNNKKILVEASEKHIEEFKKIKTSVPPEFNWVPEKSSSSFLKLHQEIDKAVKIRRIIL